MKRACGQASWADKDEEEVETPAVRHQVAGEREVLGGTITEGRISTGESRRLMTRVEFHGCDRDG